MGSAVLERELEGEGAAVQAQEAEAQPSADGGPGRELPVEAAGLRPGEDRRPLGVLPAGALEAETFLEPLGAFVDLERDLALLLEPPPAALAVAHEAARHVRVPRQPDEEVVGCAELAGPPRAGRA